jgi:hypothetical protein
MLTQDQADQLIAMFKEATRRDVFVWEQDQRQEEAIVAIEDKKIQFILFLKRNPFEIRLHFRTRDQDIGLARVDNSKYHRNPDGRELRNQPHLHSFREGEDLKWAEAIDWYNVNDPLATLERFLEEIRTRFLSGYQLRMF